MTCGVGLCVHMIDQLNIHGEVERLKLPADNVIQGITARLTAGLQILVVYHCYPSTVPKCEP